MDGAPAGFVLQGLSGARTAAVASLRPPEPLAGPLVENNELVRRRSTPGPNAVHATRGQKPTLVASIPDHPSAERAFKSANGTPTDVEHGHVARRAAQAKAEL